MKKTLMTLSLTAALAAGNVMAVPSPSDVASALDAIVKACQKKHEDSASWECYLPVVIVIALASPQQAAEFAGELRNKGLSAEVADNNEVRISKLVLAPAPPPGLAM